MDSSPNAYVCSVIAERQGSDEALDLFLLPFMPKLHHFFQTIRLFLLLVVLLKLKHANFFILGKGVQIAMGVAHAIVVELKEMRLAFRRPERHTLRFPFHRFDECRFAAHDRNDRRSLVGARGRVGCGKGILAARLRNGGCGRLLPARRRDGCGGRREVLVLVVCILRFRENADGLLLQPRVAKSTGVHDDGV